MRRLLAATAALAILALPSPVLAGGAAGSWQMVGETAAEHNGHTATLLYDGTVLVVGGHAFNSATPGGVEIFNPARGRWTAGAPTAFARSGHAAVRLDDGRVLVVGGIRLALNEPYLPVAAAELFDPVAGTWSPAASMAGARLQPTATLLGDGRVLVAGGGSGGEAATASVEIYDPAADRWAPAAPMSTARVEASALLLRNGDVLVAGGASAAANQDGSLDTAEVYDPRSNRWKPTPEMTSAHAGADSAVLGDGTVLVAGGLDYQGGYGIAVQATDLYNPALNSWSSGPPLLVARGQAGGALLANGSFLVVGGRSRSNARSESTAELFDPLAKRWRLLPLLPETRVGSTVTAVPGGRALVVGGSSRQAAELFAPPARAEPGVPATTASTIAANRPLLALTALLLLALAVQAGWKRRRGSVI